MKWLPIGNSGVMVASIPGNSRMEQVDPRIVPLARVETFTGHGRGKGIPGVVSGAEVVNGITIIDSETMKVVRLSNRIFAKR